MFDGIINVYKEKGFTSHDVVAKLRGILKQKKIGHTGTLDPDATGVLPVCLGVGTKLCDMLTDKSKEYVADMLLGVVTDTEDISGTILQRNSVNVDEDSVKNVINSFCGEYMQVPPMYSALKVNGKKLYEFARQGVEIERKARKVEIIEIEILKMDIPHVRFRVRCSKGTYIRSLCRDIGEKLSCGACMENLVRTRVGSFLIENSMTLSEIESQKETIQNKIVPVDECFLHLKDIIVGDRNISLVKNGNMFRAEEYAAKDREEFRVYLGGEKKCFAGIYMYSAEKNFFLPRKMFLHGD